MLESWKHFKRLVFIHYASLEPGYYDEEEGFGIRLENVVRVEKVNLTNDFQNSGYLGFEDLTWVPYQHKLIDFSILTDTEVTFNI